MSLTLWHRNPILLMLRTCYSEVQLTTLTTVSLLRRCAPRGCTFASSMYDGSQLLESVNMHIQGSSRARKQRSIQPLSSARDVIRDTAEMPAYFMDVMAQMLNFQRNVCKKFEVVNKIDRMEAVISS